MKIELCPSPNSTNFERMFLVKVPRGAVGVGAVALKPDRDGGKVGEKPVTSEARTRES